MDEHCKRGQRLLLLFGAFQTAVSLWLPFKATTKQAASSPAAPFRTRPLVVSLAPGPNGSCPFSCCFSPDPRVGALLEEKGTLCRLGLKGNKTEHRNPSCPPPNFETGPQHEKRIQVEFSWMVSAGTPESPRGTGFLVESGTSKSGSTWCMVLKKPDGSNTFLVPYFESQNSGLDPERNLRNPDLSASRDLMEIFGKA